MSLVENYSSFQLLRHWHELVGEFIVWNLFCYNSCVASVQTAKGNALKNKDI
jgi:hypothetical protein